MANARNVARFVMVTMMPNKKPWTIVKDWPYHAAGSYMPAVVRRFKTLEEAENWLGNLKSSVSKTIRDFGGYVIDGPEEES